MSHENRLLRTLAALSFLTCAAQVQAIPTRVLDDFSAGDISVTTTVNSSFGQPVAGVFGGNRTILLLKESESSATSMTVGNGVLTWNETGRDFAGLDLGAIGTSEDLSAYNAFRITVLSAPVNAGTLDFVLWYHGAPNHNFGARATTALPTSGIVDVPFSLLRIDTSFPPIDLTQVGNVVMEFPGDTQILRSGTYVFDDLLAVRLPDAPLSVPEPATALLLLTGITALARRR